MKKLTLLILTIAVLTALLSCKKKDSSPSKTDLLSGKWWINTAMTVDPPIMLGTTPITDAFSQIDGCIKDNLQKFDANGVYTFDEGSTKCATNDAQTIPGTWAFNSDQTIVSVSWGGDTRSYTIIELTATSLKAKYTELDDWGAGALNYTYTITAVVH